MLKPNTSGKNALSYLRIHWDNGEVNNDFIGGSFGITITL